MRESTKPVGFVGIGNMGAPMVRCLVKAGFRAVIYDTRHEAAEAVAMSTPGTTCAEDLPSLAGAVEVVITMLPDSGVVRRAVLGSDKAPGLVGGLAPGSLVVDMSSSFPPDTRALGVELAARGIGLVDAPVSGGVPKAISGKLAIMAGGEPRDLDRAVPLLAAMGTVYPAGGLGTGHAMKALNNYVSAAGLIAACEALVIGERFGLDPHVMTTILNASTGKNNTTENKLERYMLSGAYNSGFGLALMAKDVSMARRLAADLGLSADELETVSAVLTRALGRLGPQADHTAYYAYALEASDRGVG